MFPIAGALLAGLAGLSAVLFSSDEKVPEKEDPRNKKFSFNVSGETITCVHKDLNDNNLVDTSESLECKTSQSIFSQFNSDFQSRYHLPDLKNINLQNWKDAHKSLFPKGATLKQEERLTNIQEFSRIHGIQLNEVLKLGFHIFLNSSAREGANSDFVLSERLDALFLSSILMSLYKNPQSQFIPNNAAFPQIPLNIIAGGKLKLQESPPALSEQSNTLPTIRYLEAQDIFYTTIPLDKYSPYLKTTTVEALVRILQDSQKREGNFQNLEIEAYESAGRYLLGEYGFDSTDQTSDNLASFLNNNFGKGLIQTPLVQGIWLVFHKLHSSNAIQDKSLQNLKTAIDLDYLGREFWKEANSRAHERMIQNFNKIIVQASSQMVSVEFILGEFKKQSEKLAKNSENSIRDLKQFYETHQTVDPHNEPLKVKIFQALFDLLLKNYQQTLYLNILQIIQGEMKKGRQMNPLQLSPKLSLNNPSHQKILKPLLELSPTSHLWITLSGIE